MFIYLLDIEIKIYDSFSLKDKRKVVKSIIDYARNTLKISSAEISANDIKNFAHLGFVTISNQNDRAKEFLENLLIRIEKNYPVEVTNYSIERI
ncbi:DUF503 domain-containing protein [Anaerococcus sp. Marseille-Q5996]|uniref:DUF503 domain-containing protein n=1 Tax=Anaerococcus sp. Marseille-Q5996 TaxID=2972769 RepID=UPI0021C9699A|nr:DUF503 domain-containing protein [Anaerococcus sp. Marseille-Q5996]